MPAQRAKGSSFLFLPGAYLTSKALKLRIRGLDPQLLALVPPGPPDRLVCHNTSFSSVLALQPYSTCPSMITEDACYELGIMH